MLNFGSMRAPLAAMLALGLSLTATPAPAQQMTAETPGTALSRYIRVLAGNPRDFNALIGAGKAALDLGDVQAATGFFGRAEEVNPRLLRPRPGSARRWPIWAMPTERSSISTRHCASVRGP